MINQNFVIVGFILQLIGGSSYLIDTIKGKIQPNRVSFFLWGLSPLIAFAAEVQQKVGLQSLMTFSVGFVPLVIFIASFYNKKAVWKLGKFDYICGAFSVLGLMLWYMTKIGNIAILFSIVSDAFASIPTLRKSFTHPESENYIEYLFAFFNAIIALLTVRVWSFATYAFPLYIVVIDVLLVSLIKFRLGKRNFRKFVR
jgi:hypothetical protein